MFEFDSRTRRDVISVPAGTVHAIGAGVALAEIQQSSDVTFRLFDWNRRDVQGRLRPLHLEQALKCIDFKLGPVSPLERHRSAKGTFEARASIDSQPRPFSPLDDCPQSEELIRTEHFLWRRHRATGTSVQLPEEDCSRILTLIEGSAQVFSSHGRESLVAGDSLLIPAASGPLELAGIAGTVLLETQPVQS